VPSASVGFTKNPKDTVDGRNPAPVGRWFINYTYNIFNIFNINTVSFIIIPYYPIIYSVS
jgi:hypothetical protein